MISIRRMNPSLQLFLGMSLIYLSFFGGHYVMGDHATRMAWAKALLDHGSHDISSYMPGTKYSLYGIGHTLIHVPSLLLSRAIGFTTGVSCEGPINMLVYVLNGALAVMFLQRIGMQYGLTAGPAAMRALIVGVASIWFPYTKVEYSGSLVVTALLAMWTLAPTRPFLAGLAGGLAITLRSESLLWVTITFAFMPVDHSGRLRIALGILPGIVLSIWSNWLRTGLPYSSGYDTANFSNPIWIGSYGILFSAGKSIFLFSPLLVLAVLAAWDASRESTKRRFGLWALVLFLGQLLFYSAWWDWSGDDNWGVRFMIPSVLVLHAVLITSKWVETWIFRILAVVGILLQLPPVLIGPHTSLMMQHRLEPTKVNIFMDSRSPITIEDTRFDPRYSQITATWELLVYKLTGHRFRSSNPNILGSTWIEGFETLPALPWDNFWIMLLSRQHTSRHEGSRD